MSDKFARLASATEETLLENLNSDDELLLAKVFKSLAQVGTEKSLPLLDRLPEPTTDYARKQLEMAKLVIAARAGSSRRSARLVRWLKQPAKPIEGERVRQMIKSLASPTFGISLNPELAFEVDFRGPKLTLLLEETLKRDAFAQSLAARKLIAGLVVAEDPHMLRPVVRYVVTTNPTPTSVEIVATKINGELAFAGELVGTGNDLRLTMRDVGAQRLLAQIDGQVSNERVQFEVRLWQGATRPKQRPLNLISETLPLRFAV